jgi:hypothetical protein
MKTEITISLYTENNGSLHQRSRKIGGRENFSLKNPEPKLRIDDRIRKKLGITNNSRK